MRRVLHAVEAVGGQGHHERHAVLRRAVGQLVQGADQAVVRLLVATEALLDAGARRGEPHPLLVGAGRRTSARPSRSADRASSEAAGGGEGAGGGRQQLDALRRPARCRAAAAAPPRTSGPRWTGRRRAVAVAASIEHGDGGAVAVAGRLLDVVTPAVVAGAPWASSAAAQRACAASRVLVVADS